MQSIRITYDPEGDILYVTYGQPTVATGYQLSDQILLRVNLQTQKAVGLTILNFSVHSRAEDPLRLTGIEEIPEDKPLLLHILNTPPVNHFLQIIEGDQGVSATLLKPSLQEALVE